jgi:hypothetical protein
VRASRFRQCSDGQGDAEAPLLAPPHAAAPARPPCAAAPPPCAAASSPHSCAAHRNRTGAAVRGHQGGRKRDKRRCLVAAAEAAGLGSQLPPLQFLQLAFAQPSGRPLSSCAALLLLRVRCGSSKTLHAVGGRVCLYQHALYYHTLTMQCCHDRVAVKCRTSATGWACPCSACCSESDMLAETRTRCAKASCTHLTMHACLLWRTRRDLLQRQLAVPDRARDAKSEAL